MRSNLEPQAQRDIPKNSDQSSQPGFLGSFGHSGEPEDLQLSPKVAILKKIASVLPQAG
jgi:hypothetical protein